MLQMGNWEIKSVNTIDRELLNKVIFSKGLTV